MAIAGSNVVFTPDYDPTCLRTDVAGKLVKRLVPDGSHLNKGDDYAEIEVMKMFMPLKVEESGTITWNANEGAALSPGQILASFTLDNPDMVKTATIFSDNLSALFDKPKEASRSDSFLLRLALPCLALRKKPTNPLFCFRFRFARRSSSSRQRSFSTDSTDGGGKKRVGAHVHLRQSVLKLKEIMSGFVKPPSSISSALETLAEAVCDLALPAFEVEEQLSVNTGRMDAALFSKIEDLVNEYKSTNSNVEVSERANLVEDEITSTT